MVGPQGASSRPMWETLEGMVREKAQEFIQQIMEEVKSRVVCKSERKLLDASVRLPWRPPSVREA